MSATRAVKKPKTVRVRIAVAVSKVGFAFTEDALAWGDFRAMERAKKGLDTSIIAESFIEADLPIVETAVVKGRVKS